jgi:hypothetical protein
MGYGMGGKTMKKGKDSKTLRHTIKPSLKNAGITRYKGGGQSWPNPSGGSGAHPF